MTRYRMQRTHSGNEHPLPPPARFSSRSLTIIAAAAFGLLVLVALAQDGWRLGGLGPDPAYKLPVGWPYPGLVPPRGAQPASSPDFLAIMQNGKGDTLHWLDDGVVKQGISFAHQAPPQEMQDYFQRMLEQGRFEYSGREASGYNSVNVLAVWNSEDGLTSVVLSEFGGRYELLLLGK
ncbi:MAG: hypothetical protein R3F46_15475 [bacterium]